jgi:crotonobetainyl-CoA:carnitine CoA-transferase CaiB-like acyl-CoA transferase
VHDQPDDGAHSPAPPTAFGGVKVLDLSRVLAGPHCGQMFADFGADVIKVEDVGGDENRRWAPVIDGQSANFASVNRGKRAMTLNLKHREGQAVLRALVERSDVVIDSFLPDTAARLGVDDASLRRIRPDLIHVTISGYGDAGPLRSKPGYDLMLQAFSGMMSITGEPDGNPIRAGASLIDMTTGILAFAGASTALYARRSGIAGGQHVRVSLLESAMALLGYHAVDVWGTGRQPPRGGSGVWSLVPYQGFRTSDGWVLAGATNDEAWRRLCVAMDASELADRDEFSTNDRRIANREALIPSLQALFSRRTTVEWVERLEAARVACSPINDVPTALAHPQVTATGMRVDVTDSAGVHRRLVGPPIKLDATPARPGEAPPYLGEHTRQILESELGMTPARIDELREAGAL